METAQIEMERILGRTLGLLPGSKVLDAGAGYGRVAHTLTAEFRLAMTGIDLIERRLLKGSQLNHDANISPINLVNADYLRLPFPNDAFDGVYTMETLVHATDYKQVLDEFLRILKPGGRIALFEYSIPNLDSVPRIPRYIAESVIKKTGMASLPNFTHGSFSSILTHAGFENVQAEDISRNVYASWFYLWKFATRTMFEDSSKGNIGLKYIPGSFWIWPARYKLGYNICQANKPE